MKSIYFFPLLLQLVMISTSQGTTTLTEVEEVTTTEANEEGLLEDLNPDVERNTEDLIINEEKMSDDLTLDEGTNSETLSIPGDSSPDQMISDGKKNSCPDQPDRYNFEEVRRDLEAGNITLIDVRSRMEVNEDGKIPKSVLIPLDELEDVFRASLRMKNVDFLRQFGFRIPRPNVDTIVVSCQVGVRALHAYLKVFKVFGYCNTKVYTGSFADWVQNGGEIIKTDKSVTV